MAKKNRLAELALLIMNAGRLLHQKMHEGGGTVSMLHFKILCFIGEQGPTPMKDLSAFLGITAPSVTVLVDRLVRSGEITRVASAGDRRSVSVKLTKAGRQTVLRGRKALIERMSAILARLSRDEVSRLSALLNNLLKK